MDEMLVYVKRECGCLFNICVVLLLGLQHNVILRGHPYGVGLEEKLLPSYLKDIGYSTHAVGKVTSVCFPFGASITSDIRDEIFHKSEIPWTDVWHVPD